MVRKRIDTGDDELDEMLDRADSEFWFYHPESESFVRMTWTEFEQSPESGLLVELGPVMTGGYSEAIRLHRDLLNKEHDLHQNVRKKLNGSKVQDTVGKDHRPSKPVAGRDHSR